MARTETFAVDSPQAMRALGASLASRVRPGEWLLLFGELGAGKTTLARGLLEALGASGPARSPTFPIVIEYGTTPPVRHVDLYRVASDAGLDLEDASGEWVTVVEWPKGSIIALPDSMVWRVQIEFAEPGRHVQIEAPRSMDQQVPQ